MKQRHPDLRIVSRTSPQHVEEMLDAGAEGAIISFADEAAMREFARSHL